MTSQAHTRSLRHPFMTVNVFLLLVVLLVVATPAFTDDGELSERVDLLLDQLTGGGLSMSRSATVALQSLGEECRQRIRLKFILMNG